MYLIRSAFWLTAAFLVMKPHTDLGSVAGSISGQAIAAGQKVIVEQINATPCTDLSCQGGKLMLSAVFASNPSIDSPMQESPVLVPIPRPRPDWMG